jgi:hypothetical protein
MKLKGLKFWLAPLAISVVLAWYTLPVLIRCEVSEYTRQSVLENLTPDEQKTLKGMPTLSDEARYCPLYFEYRKGGNRHSASVLYDLIRGPEIFYSDLGVHVGRE